MLTISLIITFVPSTTLVLLPPFYRWEKETWSSSVTCPQLLSAGAGIWTWVAVTSKSVFLSHPVSMPHPPCHFVLWPSLACHPMSFKIPVQEASPHLLPSTNHSPCQHQGWWRESRGLFQSEALSRLKNWLQRPCLGVVENEHFINTNVIGSPKTNSVPPGLLLYEAFNQ